MTFQPPEQDTIARLASAAREVGFEPSDDDDTLAPARPLVWSLLLAAAVLSIAFALGLF